MARNPEQIERDIEATRQRAVQTVAALEERIAPGRMIDDAIAYVRHSDMGRRVGRNLRDTIVGNPVPVALLTVGAAWLAASTMMQRREHSGMGAPITDEEIVVAGLEEGDRYAVHTHLSRSLPSAPAGEAPSADNLLGQTRAEKSAAESARIFEKGDKRMM